MRDKIIQLEHIGGLDKKEGGEAVHDNDKILLWLGIKRFMV
jgi:hypothetical protein